MPSTAGEGKYPLMFKRLLMFAALAGVAAVVVQSVPDVRRYLRIRSM